MQGDVPSTTLENQRRLPATPRFTAMDQELPARSRAPLILPPVARAVFVTARAEADPTTGIMEDRTRLEALVQRSKPQIRFWLGHLETRRYKGRQLARRHGPAQLWVNLSEIPGIPVRPEVKDPLRDRTQRTQNGDWHALRARVGGLERAIREVQGQRDLARTELAKANGGAKVKELEVELVTVRALLAHATACTDPDCERCWDLAERLRDHDPTEPTGLELLK